MKTKIYNLDEYDDLAMSGQLSENDIKNGIKGHIAVACPIEHCGAKLWDDESRKVIGRKQPVECQVCCWQGYRIRCKR